MKSNVSNSLEHFFRKFGDYIRSPIVRSLSKTKTSDFTRIYKFPWFDVILYLIFRSEKTSQGELSKYFSDIGRPGYQVSKQAMLKAVNKLNPNVFIDLIHHFAELFYQSEDLVKTYRGYILLAEDGTTLELRPTVQALMQYGFVTNSKVKDMFDAVNATSRSSALYDVTNGLVVDFTMENYSKSEIPMAAGHLLRMHSVFDGRRIIYLADRYYDSVELQAILESYGFYYCIRGKSNFFRHYIEKMTSDDEWITVEVDKPWQRRLKYSIPKERFVKDPTFRLRIVKYKYSYTDINGIPQTTDLIYFTNLPKEEFSSQEIVNLYERRWDIECSYKTLKTDYEWERYLTSASNAERNMIFAKVLFHNIVGVIRKEMNRQLQADNNPKNKYGYTINIAQLAKMIRENNLVRWLRTSNRKAIMRTMDVILGLINKIKVPVRPGRHHQRWGAVVTYNHPHRYRLDGRHDPRVRTYQGCMMTVKP